MDEAYQSAEWSGTLQDCKEANFMKLSEKKAPSTGLEMKQATEDQHFFNNPIVNMALPLTDLYFGGRVGPREQEDQQEKCLFSSYAHFTTGYKVLKDTETEASSTLEAEDETSRVMQEARSAVLLLPELDKAGKQISIALKFLTDLTLLELVNRNPVLKKEYRKRMQEDESLTPDTDRTSKDIVMDIDAAIVRDILHTVLVTSTSSPATRAPTSTSASSYALRRELARDLGLERLIDEEEADFTIVEDDLASSCEDVEDDYEVVADVTQKETRSCTTPPTQKEQDKEFLERMHSV
ncbi:unnamed protein product, partial [Amoebophrya sp. A25]|eukprot:GSA25T00024909001.1